MTLVIVGGDFWGHPSTETAMPNSPKGTENASYHPARFQVPYT